jgi:hypothetical protein
VDVGFGGELITCGNVSLGALLMSGPRTAGGCTDTIKLWLLFAMFAAMTGEVERKYTADKQTCSRPRRG